MEIRPLSTRLIKPNFYVSPSYRRSTKRSLETGNIFKTTKSPVSQSRNCVCAKEKHETNELTGVRFPIAKLTSRAPQSQQTAFANAYEFILIKKILDGRAPDNLSEKHDLECLIALPFYVPAARSILLKISANLYGLDRVRQI